MTNAQRATLQAVQDAGIEVGATFLAQDVFPARDAVDNAHRRTLAQLVEGGVLTRGEPAWANNVYIVQDDAYDRLQEQQQAPQRGYTR